ncbi:hypothetical protein P691DRAFT_653993, partial [Macrolepiota fuliginosa MF-IS2]
MQRSAVLWIIGAFCTSPKGGVESIVGLIPITYHIHKLAKQCSSQYCTLPPSHPLKLLMRDKDNVVTQKLKYASPAFNMMKESTIISDRFQLLSSHSRPGSHIINIFGKQIHFKD